MLTITTNKNGINISTKSFYRFYKKNDGDRLLTDVAKLFSQYLYQDGREQFMYDIKHADTLMDKINVMKKRMGDSFKHDIYSLEMMIRYNTITNNNKIVKNNVLQENSYQLSLF